MGVDPSDSRTWPETDPYRWSSGPSRDSPEPGPVPGEHWFPDIIADTHLGLACDLTRVIILDVHSLDENAAHRDIRDDENPFIVCRGPIFAVIRKTGDLDMGVGKQGKPSSAMARPLTVPRPRNTIFRFSRCPWRWTVKGMERNSPLSCLTAITLLPKKTKSQL